uniref:Uncharacterized protein n=1 Tax=Aegilops tauschii subsp. strangulata TaxID=200361 RepID=A0A453RMA2_AEGTS
AAAAGRRQGRGPAGSRAADQGGGQGLPLRPPRRVRDPLCPLLPHRLHPLQGSRKCLDQTTTRSLSRSLIKMTAG